MTERQPTSTTPTGTRAADRDRCPQYEIRIKGHLEARWAAWFDGLTLAAEDDGTTVLRGPVVDQAALHGLLQRLRDLGIPLMSLTQLDPEPRPERSSGRPHPDAQESSP